MNRTVRLSDDEAFTLTEVLRVAADQYDEYEKAMNVIGQPRLAEQFKHQAANARELQDRLETAEYIEYLPVVD